MVATIPKPTLYPFGDVNQTVQEAVEEGDEDIYFRITKSRYQGSADITTGFTLLPEGFIPHPDKTQTWVRSTPDFIYIDTIIPPKCSKQECLKQIYEFQQHQKMLKVREEMESKLMMTKKQWQEWQGFSDEELLRGVEESKESDFELIHDSRRFTFSGTIGSSRGSSASDGKGVQVQDLCGCLARRERREAELEWREKWESNRKLKQAQAEA